MSKADFVYYVGDLCYALTDTEWDTVCAQVDTRGEMLEAIATEDGYDCEFYLEPENFDLTDTDAARPFVCFSTAYGDGCYVDTKGREYPVDSGTIGMIDVRFISDTAKLVQTLEHGLGHLIGCETEIDSSECCYDEGVIVFGTQHANGVVIDTN